jgi:DNA replication protein DnaC
MPCPICDDTSWKIVERDGIRRAVRCDCWRQATAARALDEARIPRRYQHCDFDNFITYPNEKLRNAVLRAARFADLFPVVEKGLFFIGPPGIGKSHLAVATLKAAIERRGARGLFYDVRDLLKMIRGTYDPVVKTTEAEVLRPVMHTDLLVLDDLGAEKTSEWVDETLNLIVNARYSERRLTIFTSNYEEKEFDDPDSLLTRVGFRMHSRLWEMCEFVDFDGCDYRSPDRPVNAGPEDLQRLWQVQQQMKRKSDRLPPRTRGQLRGRLDEGNADLKWPGGRAGTGHS